MSQSMLCDTVCIEERDTARIIMRNYELKWSHVIVASFIALTLAACGNTSTDEILTIAAQPITHIDPAFIASDSEVLVANTVYDYLVDVGSDNQIEPRLAETWEVSEDGRTWTFTLADDVRFHDGSALSASDVVWTFNRLRETEGLPTAGLYANIAEIEATRDDLVTFILDDSNPFFLYDLSDNHALILKEGTQDADTAFNGTGPFIVDNYEPGSGGRLELSANDDYFIEGLPKMERLEIIFFDDEIAEANALRSGQVDIITQLSTPLFQSLEGGEGVSTFRVATNAFPVVRLRADEPPGDDPRVMQAMRYAIDRGVIFDLVQQGYGEIGGDTPVGPMYSNLVAEDLPLPDQDLEIARDLLSDAGYPDGLDLLLRLPDAQNFPDLAVVLKEQLAQAGINVELSVEPESVYYGDDGWLEANFGITGWGSRPYAQFYLDVMLLCDAKWNESHFCDPEFDQWVDIAGSSLDDLERKEAYQRIQEILVERGPVLIPFFFAQLGASTDRVEGYSMKAFPGRSDLRPVTIIPE
jgi:peptide/nickel transport system substrate-binding protein